MKEHGITLIALIVTVIIMIIIVTISVQIMIHTGIIQEALDVSEETKEAYQEETTHGDKVTISGKEYNNAEEYLAEMKRNKETDINWNKVLASAKKHPDQSSTNNDIGVGTDGLPVNLDLWEYTVINNNEILLNSSIDGGSPGYLNNNIINGTIQGKVPKYIKLNEELYFYTVTSMKDTFIGCSNLTIPPEIPSEIKSLDGTFARCQNLTSIPVIPDEVLNMNRTFYKCSNITGTLIINANPTNFDYCLYEAATENNTNLKLGGTSTYINQIYATRSTESNISLIQE